MPRPLFSHALPLTAMVPEGVRQLTTAQTLNAGIPVYVVDTTAGNLTMTLPSTTSCRGRRIGVVKKVQTNTLTIQRGGADVIGYAGATSVTLNNRDDIFVTVSDGAGTWIKER